MVWLVATIASLGGVAVVLAAGTQKGAMGYLEAGLGALTVVSSWFLVHMLFLLRYAREYHDPDAPPQAIDFPGGEDPDYQDFAYLSYCLGMTYQVSDTDINSRTIRRTVLRHALLSYLLGAVVLACTINLVVQVASQ